jgi:predicted DNA-binding protein
MKIDFHTSISQLPYANTQEKKTNRQPDYLIKEVLNGEIEDLETFKATVVLSLFL